MRKHQTLWADGDDYFEGDTIEVVEETPRVSPLLGPNGLPLVHLRHPMGFDLSPRRHLNTTKK